MSSKGNCPYCQAPLSVTDAPTGQPTVCPHCLSNLDNPRLAPAAAAPNVLRDIRRSRHLIGWFVWVLIIVGIGSSVIWIGYEKMKAIGAVEHYPFPLHDFAFGSCPGFIVLDLSALLAIAAPLWRYFWGKDPSITGGHFLGLVVMTLALALAIVVFFFCVCYAVDQY